jgi:hypothetical protein
MENMGMGKQNLKVEIAYGAIVANGFFALAFTLHLLSVPAGGLTVFHFIGVGIVLCVFLSACGVIWEDYWLTARQTEAGLVKKLRIKELKKGAHIEFDGKSYQVDTIDHTNGEILIQRVGQPGSIIVQIEGQR